MSLVPVVEVKDYICVKELYNHYENVNSIFLQPKVRDRKVVIFSISGPSVFLLRNSLNFLYATVIKKTFRK